MPDTMSRTSDWLPNEMARPNTEAPAISGVMLTPSSRQHQQAADDDDDGAGDGAQQRHQGAQPRGGDLDVVLGIARRVGRRQRVGGDVESMRNFTNRQKA